MEQNEQQNKSTRTFEEWKTALIKHYTNRKGLDLNGIIRITDDQIKPYYDQGLMPEVAYKDLFNR